MTTEPLISVILPAYNYARTLPRAVESVITQLNGNRELLVIDDGSTDDTPVVLQTLQDKHSGRFRMIRKANGGASSARNLGIASSGGRYLVFLDADDALVDGALDALEAHLDANPSTRLVVGGYYSVWGNGRVREHMPTALPASPLERLRAYLLGKRVSLSNGACAMHRDIFVYGLYPENFRSAEDIPVFAQALANVPCSTLNRPLAMIYKHSDSLRHQFVFDQVNGLALVEEVFSEQRLGAAFQALKSPYSVQRCLSLFRSAYLAEHRVAAKHFFIEALKRDWRVLLKGSYTRKAVRLWTGW
ncbi:glycosyltransferase family A protein [uncultured Pseudomonas sp.]|uniref:glycosyltransferase family 2 protein n=1 Tax=uncultured Pseudomonas sp. TaxID=114707 RepID=UPI00344D1FD8